MTESFAFDSSDRDATRRQIAEAVSAPGTTRRITNNPALQALGTVVELASPSKAEISFEIGSDAIQGNGVVGGGTMAAMLDAGLAISVMTLLEAGQLCATVSLTVNMMRSAEAGAFAVKARVTRMGRTMSFADAELFDAQERLVATATSALAVVRP